MEVFAIMFSFPAAFIACSIYAIIVRIVISKWKSLITPLFASSLIILLLLILEFIGVLIFGAVRLRGTIGPAYYPIHSFLFLFALPSLVNVLQTQKRIPIISKWYIIGIIGAFVGLSVVLFQYVVSEALYGVDGVGGPYGTPF